MGLGSKWWVQGVRVYLLLSVAFPWPIFAAPEGRDLVIEELKEKTVLWVLSIGVSKYKDERINLQFADHDAERIAQMLQTQEGLLFREVYTKVLVNADATREQILRGMSEFLGQAAPEDVVLIFLAGHGLQDRQTQTYYFVPHNASADNLIYAGLPMPIFEEAVKRLRANVNKVVLWLDTCHAGAMSIAARGVNTGEDLAEALRVGEGQYVLSASKAGEESLEDAKYRFDGFDRAHGAFTFSLLRGLKGKAANDEGVVWLSDLLGHVSREVPRLTGGKQHPHSQMEGTDLPLFVLDEEVLAQFSAVDDELVQVNTSSSEGGTIGGTKKQNKRWLWMLLGAGAVGGAGAVLLGGGEDKPGEGTVVVEVQMP